MVYCSGLPSNLTQDQLTSQSYFGQYGKIEKIVVNPFPNRNYCSAYLTYSHQFQAATAILACNDFQICRSTLWCLFGTMKYCRFFLKKIQCKNIPNCPYLHAFDQKNEIEIQNSPSEAFPEHEKLAKQVFKKYPQKIKQLKTQNGPTGQLPQPYCAVEYIQQQKEENNLSEKSKIEKKQNKIAEKLNQQAVAMEIKDIEIEQQPDIDIDYLIKKLILKQLDRSKGSRLLTDIKLQQKIVKQIIINELMD